MLQGPLLPHHCALQVRGETEEPGWGGGPLNFTFSQFPISRHMPSCSPVPANCTAQTFTNPISFLPHLPKGASVSDAKNISSLATDMHIYRTETHLGTGKDHSLPS